MGHPLEDVDKAAVDCDGKRTEASPDPASEQRTKGAPARSTSDTAATGASLDGSKQGSSVVILEAVRGDRRSARDEHGTTSSDNYAFGQMDSAAAELYH
ncbi:hypothetical protein TRIUR3_18686 [Triticum urartu]|uniref:Uncharacterized protein n=1 Tax=Triticum urartu TaxID=4572 RepID=M7ZT84_TRIUA|nr:hypothetical protein TRIUR3_18686 [Triticum urartu]